MSTVELFNVLKVGSTLGKHFLPPHAYAGTTHGTGKRESRPRREFPRLDIGPRISRRLQLPGTGTASNDRQRVDDLYNPLFFKE